jgi:hypothetical protein
MKGIDDEVLRACCFTKEMFFDMFKEIGNKVIEPSFKLTTQELIGFILNACLRIENEQSAIPDSLNFLQFVHLFIILSGRGTQEEKRKCKNIKIVGLILSDF